MILVSGAYGAGLIDLPGTLPFPSLGGDSGTDTDQDPRYTVNTNIDIVGTDTFVVFDEPSFEYSTSRCRFTCGFSFVGPGDSFSFFGAREVELTTTLVNSDGQRVKEVNKFIGELGLNAREETSQSFNNIRPGSYTVRYRLTGTGNLLDNPVDKTLEKEIRVPKTLQG